MICYESLHIVIIVISFIVSFGDCAKSIHIRTYLFKNKAGGAIFGSFLIDQLTVSANEGILKSMDVIESHSNGHVLIQYYFLDPELLF